MLDLKRIDQRAADTNAGDQTETGQHLAREPGDAWRLGTQPHRRGRFSGQRPGIIVGLRLGFQPGLAAFLLIGIDLAHDAGLPSVREMRTRFWSLSAPKRSSAAANSRSMIM